jgi:hypothetical protein
MPLIYEKALKNIYLCGILRALTGPYRNTPYLVPTFILFLRLVVGTKYILIFKKKILACFWTLSTGTKFKNGT